MLLDGLEAEGGKLLLELSLDLEDLSFLFRSTKEATRAVSSLIFSRSSVFCRASSCFDLFRESLILAFDSLALTRVSMVVLRDAIVATNVLIPEGSSALLWDSMILL